MKTVTHALAGGIVVITALLCSPAAHPILDSLAARSPYLAVIIPAVVSLAALYHNPKEPTPPVVK